MIFKQPLIGLDVSADAVSLVSLSKNRGKFILDQVDRDVLPARTTSENTASPADTAALSEVIRTVLARSRIRIKTVSTALSAQKTIVKVISLPDSMNAQAIEDHIQFQGNQYIPFSMDAVHFDFSVLPGSKRSGYQDVLLVACKKESLEDQVAILEESGLKAKIVDTRTFALWFLYTHLQLNHLLGKRVEGGNGVVIIETGYADSHLYVFDNGRPAYEKSHNFGYQELIKSIQSKYQLGATDALRMSRFGGLPPEYAKEVLDPFTKKASAEIAFALEFFQNSMPDVSISSICLFGEWIGLPPSEYGSPEVSNRSGLTDLSVALQQKISLPVSAPDPFAGMEISKQVHTRFLDADRSAFAVACGLALRRFYG